MFRIMNEFKRSDIKQKRNSSKQQFTNNNIINTNNEKKIEQSQTISKEATIGPTFFA